MPNMPKNEAYIYLHLAYMCLSNMWSSALRWHVVLKSYTIPLVVNVVDDCAVGDCVAGDCIVVIVL